MSDIIKKIKIKKQDGTFTDYIPIGAEASNVNVDGESVEVKLNKTPYYYNSVADMKADESLKVGDMAVTLGYYEANDGGGAEYRILTSTDKYAENLNNNLKAELIVKNIVNIKWFGAYGDNNHDDRQAIVNAIQNNTNIYIPKGTYLIYETITLKSNCIIIGEHQNTSIIKLNTCEEAGSNTIYALDANNKDNIHLENITIQGLKLENDKSLPNQRYYYGLRFYNSQNLYVNNCIFKDFYCNGISIRNSEDVTVSNCLFENNNTNGIACTQKINNIKITNNIFKDNYYQNINFEDNSTNYLVKDVMILDNFIYLTEYKSGGWGIGVSSPSSDNPQVHKYSNFIIKNNTIQNISCGIILQYIDDSYICNNNILDCTAGLRINMNLSDMLPCHNIHIEDNIIKCNTNGGYCIFLAYLTDCYIKNNDIQGSEGTTISRGMITISSTNTYLTFDNNYLHDTSNFGINILGGSHFNFFNNKIKDVYVAGIRVSSGGDMYLHFDNNEMLKINNNDMSYTIRFTADVNYVTIERMLQNSNLYFSENNLKYYIIKRDNGWGTSPTPSENT